MPRLPPAVPACLILCIAAAGACLTPAEVTGGKAPPVRSMLRDQPPVPRVLVNQVGYLPARPKVATVRNDAGAPLDWRLLDGAGKEVARGKTLPFGADRPSGDTVQLVDFSTVRAPGDGYVLEVGGERSHPFAIRADLYHHLKYDALAYFYQNRSGVPITMPYAGAPQWRVKLKSPANAGAADQAPGMPEVLSVSPVNPQ